MVKKSETYEAMRCLPEFGCLGLSLEEWIETIEDSEIRDQVIQYCNWAATQPNPAALVDILLYGSDVELADAFMDMRGIKAVKPPYPI